MLCEETVLRITEAYSNRRKNGVMMAPMRRISVLPDLKGRSADYVKIYSLFVHKSILSKTTILQEGKNK